MTRKIDEVDCIWTRPRYNDPNYLVCEIHNHKKEVKDFAR